MKSTKEVLSLNEIVKPFKVVFPITVEGSINGEKFVFPKDTEAFLTFPIYENLRHSSYSRHLDNKGGDAYVI